MLLEGAFTLFESGVKLGINRLTKPRREKRKNEINIQKEKKIRAMEQISSRKKKLEEQGKITDQEKIELEKNINNFDKEIKILDEEIVKIDKYASL